MKKIVLCYSIIFLLILVSVKAETLEIEVDPAEAWLGDSVTISCWYSGGDTNTTFTTPWAYIERMSWNGILTKINNTYYERQYNPPLLGTYDVFCSNGTLNSSQVSFKLGKLTLIITESPDIVYLEENFVIHAKVIETTDSEQTITSDVDFSLSLDGESISIDTDQTYPLGDEWIITTEELSTSFTSSTYTLSVEGTYKGETASDSESIEVKSPVEFEVVNIDKTDVRSDDNITVTLKAMEEGNPIDLKDEYLNFCVDSTCFNIVKIYRTGDYSYVTISAPSLSPGSYELKIRFDYAGFSSTQTRTIYYIVSISGQILNSDDEAVYVQLRFESNETERTFITNSGGSYSGDLPPGIYDLHLTFPNSKLILSEIMINDFDDPVKFDNPSTDVDIPGIGVGGIFVYEIALTYSNVYLEMKYDDSKILDEDEITVYKCENWNFGRKVCNGDWDDINADINTVRNSVTFNTTELSAFVIGYKKDLYLEFDSDKNEYFLKEIIRITGITEDEDTKPISDVQITASIPDTGISASTKSDSSGVFSLEFQAPSSEGDYTILVRAEKSPFSDVEQSKSIKLLRSEQVTILMPDSIKVGQSENASMWISIFNSGQTDYSDLTLSLSGIPEGYYSLPTEIPELKAGEEKKISIYFNIPEDASMTSHTGRFKLTYDDDSLEEQFILTILSAPEKNETLPTSKGFKLPTLSLPTGMIVLPTVEGDVLLIVAIVVVISSFSISVFLKRRRVPKEFERKGVKNLLLDIKREVERFPAKKMKTRIKKRRKKRKKLRRVRKTK